MFLFLLTVSTSVLTVLMRYIISTNSLFSSHTNSIYIYIRRVFQQGRTKELFNIIWSNRSEINLPLTTFHFPFFYLPLPSSTTVIFTVTGVYNILSYQLYFADHSPVCKTLVGWLGVTHVALKVPLFKGLQKYLLCQVPGEGQCPSVPGFSGSLIPEPLNLFNI